MVVGMLVPVTGGIGSIWGPPEGKDYKWYFSCQLGDGLCHRSHLLGEPASQPLTFYITQNSLWKLDVSLVDCRSEKMVWGPGLFQQVLVHGNLATHAIGMLPLPGCNHGKSSFIKIPYQKCNSPGGDWHPRKGDHPGPMYTYFRGMPRP